MFRAPGDMSAAEPSATPERLKADPFAMKLRDRLAEICVDPAEVLRSFDKNAFWAEFEPGGSEDVRVQSAFFLALTDASFAGFSLDVDSNEAENPAPDWFREVSETLGFGDVFATFSASTKTRGLYGYEIAAGMNVLLAPLGITWWILPAGDDREYYYLPLRSAAVQEYLDDDGFMSDVDASFLDPKDF